MILAVCDFDLAVRLAVEQFDNSGQVCLGAFRILVDESIADRFQDAVLTRASTLALGDPRDEATEMSYALDLVRLAVSAVLADDARNTSVDYICDTILDGYEDGLKRPRATVLDRRHGWSAVITPRFSSVRSSSRSPRCRPC